MKSIYVIGGSFKKYDLMVTVIVNNIKMIALGIM